MDIKEIIKRIFTIFLIIACMPSSTSSGYIEINVNKLNSIGNETIEIKSYKESNKSQIKFDEKHNITLYTYKKH